MRTNATKKTTGDLGRNRRSVKRRSMMAVALVVAVVIAACTPPPGPETLRAVKAQEYGDWAAAQAPLIADGTAHPIVEFSVAETPPSIFVNFVIPDEKAADFLSFIEIPPTFQLAKLRILDSDVPRYWLSLNVYEVSGITNGLRAEWSTYVDDGSGVPRFMIVRARAADGSIDPIGPFAFPEPFDHAVDTDEVITTAMKKTEENIFGVPQLTEDDLFTSTIQLPDAANRQFVDPSLEWVAANDFIFWSNGVNDRTFYNSSAHSAPLISVDLADVTLFDDSEWATFFDPTPAHVLVYLEEIKFAIAPWWNVTEPDGNVDPATLASLLDFKKGLYGGFAATQVLGIRGGSVDPVVRSAVENAPPSTYWHWRIPAPNLADFQTVLDLPAGLSLAPVALEAGDAPDHWLTLNVSEVSGGLTEGLRAEWSTHVNDGDGVRALVIEARADHPALDPTNVMSVDDPYTPATPLTHAVAGGSVDTTVGSGATAFTSSFAAPGCCGATVLPAREWVGANDLRYWTNGVADRTFYQGPSLQSKASVNPATATVTDGGPWAAYVNGDPDRVWVDTQVIDLVSSPWSIIPDE